MPTLNIAGLDLGQTTNFSALCLCTRYDKSPPSEPDKEDEPEEKKEGHSLDDLVSAASFTKHPEAGSLTNSLVAYRAGEAEFDQDLPAPDDEKPIVQVKRYYACRALHRWPMGTSYVDIVNNVRSLDQRMSNLVLVVDNSGVGRPVVDMFRKARLRCKVVPVTISSGKHAIEKPKTAEWTVPKVELVSALQVILQNRRMLFPKGMKYVEELINELQEFKYRITQAANDTYGASEGEQDDIVLSTALIAWYGEKAVRRLKAW